jgi:hypothetical protein
MAESQILDPHLMRIASSRQKEIRSKGSTGYHPKERERRKVDKKGNPQKNINSQECSLTLYGQTLLDRS